MWNIQILWRSACLSSNIFGYYAYLTKDYKNTYARVECNEPTAY
jgi:hypothetical protein